MTMLKKPVPPKIDLEAEAAAALEAALRLPPGPERTEALKQAGILQNAVDAMDVIFGERGGPSAKTRR